MNLAPVKPVAGAGLWLSRLAQALVVLWSLGWLMHTSFDPVVLGKYNLRYTIFLGAVLLVFLPLALLFIRFLSTTSELRSSRDRRIPITPRQKLMAFAFLSLAGYVVGTTLIHRFIAGTVGTHDAHAFHPYLQNIPLPGHAGQHVNQWGFKGDEIELAKSDKTFRIFVFGGSTVHCGTVEFEQTHCRVLEKRLREAYPDYQIEVQNLGAEWHSTQHDVMKLLFIAQDFQPDLVIMFHGINDLVRGFTPDLFGEGPYRPDYRHYLGAVTNLVHPDRALFTATNLFGGHWLSDWRCDAVRLDGPEGKGLHGAIVMFFPKSRPVEVENWQSLPAFERNYRDFIAIAQAKKMHTLVATQPSLYREDLTPRERSVLTFPSSHQFQRQRVSLASMTQGMRQFNERAKKIATETGTRLVDLEAKMPKTTEFLYDDVHYTPAGNELIANAFADDILKWEIVPTTIHARQAPREASSAAE